MVILVHVDTPSRHQVATHLDVTHWFCELLLSILKEFSILTTPILFFLEPDVELGVGQPVESPSDGDARGPGDKANANIHSILAPLLVSTNSCEKYPALQLLRAPICSPESCLLSTFAVWWRAGSVQSVIRACWDCGRSVRGSVSEPE